MLTAAVATILRLDPSELARLCCVLLALLVLLLLLPVLPLAGSKTRLEVRLVILHQLLEHVAAAHGCVKSLFVRKTQTTMENSRSSACGEH
jgi:hypothetical protein